MPFQHYIMPQSIPTPKGWTLAGNMMFNLTIPYNNGETWSKNMSSSTFQLTKLPRWLADFLNKADQDTEVLSSNGARTIARAREAFKADLLRAACAYLNEPLSAAEAARETGHHPETIRRKVRQGEL